MQANEDSSISLVEREWGLGGHHTPLLSRGLSARLVDKKVSLVATDENQDYNYLSRDIKHESVSHSKNEGVRGQVHTNSIESFWAFLKRGVVGNFHHVS
jgi:ISXO2 transposase-like protein